MQTPTSGGEARRWTCVTLALLAGILAVPRPAMADCSRPPDCDPLDHRCWTCDEDPISGWEHTDDSDDPVQPEFRYGVGASLGGEYWLVVLAQGIDEVPISRPQKSFDADGHARTNVDGQRREEQLVAVATSARIPADEVLARWSNRFGAGVPVPMPQGASRDQAPNGEARSGDASGKLTDPVDPITGELIVEHVDLALPSFGISFEHRRVYRSRVDYDGPLGPGWDFGYNQRLFDAPPVVVAGDPSPPDLGPNGLPYAGVAPGEVTDHQGETCGPVLILTTGSGTTLRFRELVTTGGVITYTSDAADLTLKGIVDNNVTRWELTSAVGDQRRFDERGLLVAWVDANGIGLRFTWEPGNEETWRLARVEDSVGRAIAYSYDTRDRLRRVADGSSGLFAEYWYHAGHGGLEQALGADGSRESYEYDVQADRTRGDWIPERMLETTCALACAPSSSSCDAGGACDAAISDATAACLDSCPACAAECSDECATVCNSECRGGSGGCAAACDAPCNTLEHMEAVVDNCDEIYDSSGADELCHDCRLACDKLSTDNCQILTNCVAVSTNNEIRQTHIDQLCTDWSLTLDGPEDLARVFLGFFYGFWESLVCAWDWLNGRECNFDRWWDNLDQICDDDTDNCCTYGGNCAPTSCNRGLSCEDSCRATFLGRGDAGNCPAPRIPWHCGEAPSPSSPEWDDFIACAGTAQTWSRGRGCVQASLDLCEEGCTDTCSRDCAAPCLQSCSATCVEECHADDCVGYCIGLDLPGQCAEVCTDACADEMHARGPVQGPKYGFTADLQFNLVRIGDGNGQVFLENVYEDDLGSPGFDTVIEQRYGVHSAEMQHIDLVQGDRHHDWADGLADTLDEYPAPTICHFGCPGGPPDPRDLAVPWDDVVLVFDGGSGTETPVGGWSVASSVGAMTLAPTFIELDGSGAGLITRRAVESELLRDNSQLWLELPSGKALLDIDPSGKVTIEADGPARAVLAAAGGLTVFGDGFQLRAYPGHPAAVVALAGGKCTKPFHVDRTGADEVRFEPADACDGTLWLAPIAGPAAGFDATRFFTEGQDAVDRSYFLPSVLTPWRQPTTLTPRGESYLRAASPSPEAAKVAQAQGERLYAQVPLFSAPLPEAPMAPDPDELVYLFHQDPGTKGSSAYPPERAPTDYPWGFNDTPDTVYQPPCDPSLPAAVSWGAGTKPVHATAIRDLHGARWVYYADELGRLIRTVNVETGASRWMEYDLAGRVTGVLAPDGARQCLKYDAGGNVIETLSLAAEQPGMITPAPIRQRYGWTPAPVRLQAVYDPRDLTRVLRRHEYDAAGNLRATVEIDGSRTEVALVGGSGPARFMPRTITGPDGAVTQLAYDTSNGTVRTMVRDVNGSSPVIAELESDAAGRPRSTTSPLGLIESFEWDGPVLETRTWDADGLVRAEHYTHDENAQLATVARGGSTISLQHDAIGAVTSTTRTANDGSLLPASVCQQLAPGGRVLEEVSAEGARVRYAYDGEGRLTAVMAGDLGPSPEAWDDACLPTATGRPASGTLVAYEYDSRGRQTAMVDGRGHRTTWQYDGHGRVLVERRPGGGEIRSGYDGVGQLLWQAAYSSSTSPGTMFSAPYMGQPGLLAMVQVAYDLRGRIEHVARWHFDDQGAQVGDGIARTSYAYDEAARTVRVTDDLSRTGRMRLDGAGRVIEVLLPDGSAMTTAYLDGGRRVQTTRTSVGGPVTSSTLLTAAGQVLESSVAVGGTERVTGSSVWNDPFLEGASTSASGVMSKLVYDAFERVVGSATVLPGGHAEQVALVLDRDSRVIKRDSVAAPGAPASSWSFEYDALGRLWRETDPAGAARTTEFVAATPLPQRTVDARSIETIHGYSPAGLLQHAQVSGPGVEDIYLYYGYDPLGRMVSAYRQDGVATPVVTARRWDSLGNLIGESDDVIGPAANRTHVHDGVGQRVRSVLGVHSAARTFDLLGRQQSLSVDGESVATAKWSYGAPGGALSRMLGNGVESVYGYDKLSRLVAITDRRGTSQLAHHAWELPLDGVPRLGSAKRKGLPDLTRAFAIDGAGRVTDEEAGVSAGFQVDLLDASPAPTELALAAMTTGRTAYELDGRNNWKSRSVAGASTAFAVDARDALTAIGGTPVWSDATGAIIHDGTTGYEYDGLGFLAVVHPANGVGRRYQRDGLGRVVAETNTATGVTTRYAWDGDQRVISADSSGAITTTFAAEGLDAPVMSMAPDGTRTYYHQDRQGSVYAHTNDAGWPTRWMSYSAYGETTLHDGAGRLLTPLLEHNGFGFHGLPHDFVLGMVDMRARAYVPRLGRFLSADPIGLAGGPNLFAFVDSSPLAYRDPFGLSKKDSLLKMRGPADAGDIWRDLFSLREPSWTDEALDFGSSVVGHYADYAEGKVDGVVDAASDLAEGAWSSAKCGAKGPLCIYEKIRGAPGQARAAIDTVAAIPDLARAVADDPKRALCGDKCDFHDLGYAEGKVAVAVVTGAGPGLAGKAAQAAKDLVKFFRAWRTARRINLLAGAAGGAGKLPRFQGPKPTYHVNEAHVPGPKFNPKKEVLPADAAEVYKTAVPDAAEGANNWYGKNANGTIYRFSNANDGTAHFSGSSATKDGIRNITLYARQRLEGN